MTDNDKTIAAINALLDLSKQLPKGLRSDWRDTNHYELQAPYDDWFWLDMGDGLPIGENNCETETGQRVGLVMDAVEALKKAEPSIEALVTELTDLRQTVERLARCSYCGKPKPMYRYCSPESHTEADIHECGSIEEAKQ